MAAAAAWSTSRNTERLLNGEARRLSVRDSDRIRLRLTATIPGTVFIWRIRRLSSKWGTATHVRLRLTVTTRPVRAAWWTNRRRTSGCRVGERQRTAETHGDNVQERLVLYGDCRVEWRTATDARLRLTATTWRVQRTGERIVGRLATAKDRTCRRQLLWQAGSRIIRGQVVSLRVIIITVLCWYKLSYVDTLVTISWSIVECYCVNVNLRLVCQVAIVIIVRTDKFSTFCVNGCC